MADKKMIGSREKICRDPTFLHNDTRNTQRVTERYDISVSSVVYAMVSGRVGVMALPGARKGGTTPEGLPTTGL